MAASASKRLRGSYRTRPESRLARSLEREGILKMWDKRARQSLQHGQSLQQPVKSEVGGGVVGGQIGRALFADGNALPLWKDGLKVG